MRYFARSNQFATPFCRLARKISASAHRLTELRSSVWVSTGRMIHFLRDSYRRPRRNRQGWHWEPNCAQVEVLEMRVLLAQMIDPTLAIVTEGFDSTWGGAPATPQTWVPLIGAVVN